jgi:type II secretory pathway component PulK
MKLKRNTAMILVTVVMVVFVMSLLLTAILSQNLSQAYIMQDQIDEIKAKELALGAFWRAQAELTNNINPTTANLTETLDGKVFTVSVDPIPATSASTQYDVRVSY